MSAFGNIGIGPGFGPDATHGGTRALNSTVTIAGDLTWDLPVVPANSINLNTLSACGDYSVQTPTNAPAGSDTNLYIQVVCSQIGGYTLQYATNLVSGNNNTWIRTETSGTWGELASRLLR